MLNSIVDAIAIKLDAEFGGATIYTEEVPQGFEEPCFFIKLLPTNQDQIIGKRYFRKQPCDIHFFPSVGGGNAEINNTIDKLNDCLEVITVGADLVRGSKMHSETVDGVLHYFVNYHMHVIKAVTPEEPMNSIKTNTQLKG